MMMPHVQPAIQGFVLLTPHKEGIRGLCRTCLPRSGQVLFRSVVEQYNLFTAAVLWVRLELVLMASYPASTESRYDNSYAAPIPMGMIYGNKETEPNITCGYLCSSPCILGVHASQPKKSNWGLSSAIYNAGSIKRGLGTSCPRSHAELPDRTFR